MILPINSNLRNPPKIISPRQVLVLNAIRFSIDICEISFSRLIANLEKFNNDTKDDLFNVPSIFLDVWSIINNSVIFKKILCNEFKIDEYHAAFTAINKAKNFRDSNQHLDERLKEDILIYQLPVNGMLSWRTQRKEKNVFDATVIYSGAFESKKNVKMTISNPDNVDKLMGKINMIEFKNIIRAKEKKKLIFIEDSVYLDQIIYDIKEWVEFLDLRINEQLKDYDISEKHQPNLILKLGPIRAV